MTLHKEKPVKEAKAVQNLPEPEPVSQPPVPVSQPAKPASRPPDLVSHPPEPVSQPPKPVFHSPEPVFQPFEPVFQPPEPVSQPSEPVTQPSKPVSQPSKSVSQPPKPVFQPPEPVSHPPEPVSQPPKSVSQPPEPVSQPLELVLQPPKPVSQPPEPVSQPPEPVFQPPEPVLQPPITTQIPQPQSILSATSMNAHHTNNKDQGPSSESELYNSKDLIKNVPESVTSSDKNFKKSSRIEPSFPLRKSSSVSNFRIYESSSRSVSDELQQKLNKRLNKETDFNALEKLETTVKQHMGRSKAIAEDTDASLDKGGHGGIVEKKVRKFIYLLHVTYVRS